MKFWWEVYNFCVLKKPNLDSFICVPMREIFLPLWKINDAQRLGSSCQVEGTVVLYSAVWLSGLLLIEIWHCERSVRPIGGSFYSAQQVVPEHGNPNDSVLIPDPELPVCVWRSIRISRVSRIFFFIHLIPEVGSEYNPFRSRNNTSSFWVASSSISMENSC
jgi:hypothetical protein